MSAHCGALSDMGDAKRRSDPGKSKSGVWSVDGVDRESDEPLSKPNGVTGVRSTEPRGGESEEREEDEVDVDGSSSGTPDADCWASLAFLRARAAAFFSRDAFGSLTKMHSLPREIHFVQGCLRSHLTLDSAHAWQDLRRDLFWLALSMEVRHVFHSAKKQRDEQVTATPFVAREQIAAGEFGHACLQRSYERFAHGGRKKTMGTYIASMKTLVCV
jgi:hypothetical protein